MTTNTTNISALTNAATNISITGLGSFCSGTQQYSVNAPPGTTTTWSVSPSGSLSTPSPVVGNQTSVTQIGNGTATLTATFTNTCGGNPLPVTKSIMVGQSQLTGDINPATSTQVLSMFNNITGPTTTYVSYSWPGVSNISVTTLGSNPYTAVYSYTGGFNFNLTGGLALRIAGTSTCSGSIYTDRYFTRSGGYRMAVSPNPAKDKMTVSITDIESSSKSALQEPVTMTLYNANSTLLIKRWTFNTNQKNYTLNIQGIKMGQYVLVVEKGKNRESQKITIQ